MLRQKTKQLLRKTKLRLLPGKYLIVSIPIKQFNQLNLKKFQKKFFSVVYEKNEITLIINEANWKKIKNDFKNCKFERNYRILTLDINLDWDVVGYIAAISNALADISIGVISAYSKDHLLIHDKGVNTAMLVLRQLKNGR